jgi:hypothetical protein
MKKGKCFSAIYQKAKNITLPTKTTEKDICAFSRQKKIPTHIKEKQFA